MMCVPVRLSVLSIAAELHSFIPLSVLLNLLNCSISIITSPSHSMIIIMYYDDEQHLDHIHILIPYNLQIPRLGDYSHT